MWNSWKRKARLASLFETSGCIFLWMHFCGCISIQPAEAAHLECAELYKYQIPFSQIHPRPLPSTATSASAPSARSCSVEMHWTEAAALSWTATPCKWGACLSPVVVQCIYSAVQSAQCTAVDPREWSGWWSCGAETIHQPLQGIFFRGVFLPHQHVQVSCAGQRTKLYLLTLTVLELLGVSMLAH